MKSWSQASGAQFCSSLSFSSPIVPLLLFPRTHIWGTRPFSRALAHEEDEWALLTPQWKPRTSFHSHSHFTEVCTPHTFTCTFPLCQGLSPCCRVFPSLHVLMAAALTFQNPSLPYTLSNPPWDVPSPNHSSLSCEETISNYRSPLICYLHSISGMWDTYGWTWSHHLCLLNYSSGTTLSQVCNILQNAQK